MTTASKTRDIGFTALLLVTAVLCIGMINFVFLRVPDEKVQGIAYKIVYFHAPSAYAMYLGATACAIGSIGYLASGRIKWDAVARAGADVAVTMGAMLMISGPFWGRKIWGVYWAWDPRLVTSLLSVLIYVAYVILRGFSGSGEGERKFAAALGILGAANLPIIHYAVRKWGGIHPQVVTGEGGGMTHPDMKIALGLGFLVFTLLGILLVWQRTRIHLAQAHVTALEHEAIELGVAGE